MLAECYALRSPGIDGGALTSSSRQIGTVVWCGQAGQPARTVGRTEGISDVGCHAGLVLGERQPAVSGLDRLTMISLRTGPAVAASVTDGAALALTEAQTRSVVLAASSAPSIHNTQPWLWVTADGDLDLYADPVRHLQVADPTGQQLLISCGAALLNARLAIHSLGLTAQVTLCPSGDDRVAAGDLPAAIIRIAGAQPLSAQDKTLVDAMPARHTDRRPFSSRPVPEAVLDALRLDAEREGAWLVALDTPDRRIDTAVLTARADWLETRDPAYRAELQHWTRTGDHAVDGIPRDVVAESQEARAAEFVMRDFDAADRTDATDATGSAVPSTDVERPTVLLLGTDTDTPRAQLMAGQALARVLLDATAHGLAASPLGQAIDVGSTRALLANSVGGLGRAQMLIRIGYPVAGATPMPATPRRDISEILSTRF